jgi:predicted nucleic acid-binding Zn ribbon protein
MKKRGRPMFTSDKGACRENCNDFLKVKKKRNQMMRCAMDSIVFIVSCVFGALFFATLTSDLEQVSVNTEYHDHMTTLDYSEIVLLHDQ